MKKDIWIFVDGGTRPIDNKNLKKGFNGSYAFIATIADKGELKRFTSGGGYQSNTTTPRMEFTALKSALINTNLVLDEPMFEEEYGDVKGGTVYIVCDAMNTVKTMTDWVHKWIVLTIKKFGSIFKKENPEEVQLYRKEGSNYKPVLNQDLIVSILKCLDIYIERNMNIKFLHINSHVNKDKVETARIKFQNFNNMIIGEKDFAELLAYNEQADKMVEDYYKRGIAREKALEEDNNGQSN